MVIQVPGLFEKCFALSKHQNTIRFSHLPFVNGYYVTEHDIILKVKDPSIYRLEDSGWVNAQYYASLWYDSMKDFADIPQKIVDELALDQK